MIAEAVVKFVFCTQCKKAQFQWMETFHLNIYYKCTKCNTLQCYPRG